MWDAHPVQVLKQITSDAIAKTGIDPVFSFQAYEIIKNGYHKVNYKDREQAHIRGTDIDDQLPGFIAQATNSGYDVIVNSKMDFKGKELHMPQIDFLVPAGPFVAQKILRKALSELQENTGVNGEDILLFNSGNSYHGYAVGGLLPQRWLQYMAGLLLLNDPVCVAAVDARWIGHSLKKGYSALRITRVNSKYKQLPQPVINPYQVAVAVRSP